jgi:hypothetical protein
MCVLLSCSRKEPPELLISEGLSQEANILGFSSPEAENNRIALVTPWSTRPEQPSARPSPHGQTFSGFAGDRFGPYADTRAHDMDVLRLCACVIRVFLEREG